jgi:hypothetical protein
MPDYNTLRNQAVKQLQGGWNIFAGQADDPFFLDLRVFDLLYGGDLSETGQDTVAGYNVNTIALQVPFKDVALKGDAKRNPVIGVWSTTERNRVRVSGRTALTADRVQVSRLGNPLVNEVVVPASLKDAFNSITPDRTRRSRRRRAGHRPELPKLIEASTAPAPATPRNDLVEIFLTGITTKAERPDQGRPQLAAEQHGRRRRASSAVGDAAAEPGRPGGRTAEPARRARRDLQGFPNGRALTDDVVDIDVQAVEGAAQTGKLVDALAAGDKVDANDNAFADLPVPGAAERRRGEQGRRHRCDQRVGGRRSGGR